MSAVQFRPEPPLKANMNSQLYPILLNLFAAALSAWGQYSYKRATSLLGEIPLYKNTHLFIGMAIFLFVTLLFFLAFKLGGRLSVTYPVYASTFVWGALIGHCLDKEPINSLQIFGIALVFLGVCIVAMSSATQVQ